MLWEPKVPAGIPVFQCDRVPKAETLIVAFTGFFGDFYKIKAFDFFKLTELLEYHRILLRDPYQLCYLKGIDETGFDAFVERLRREIEAVGAKRVIFMGVSGGGFGAILLGSLLGADYVYAFSPYTYVNWNRFVTQVDIEGIVKRWQSILGIRLNIGPEHRHLFDLKSVLQKSGNRNVKYRLFACEKSIDARRVRYLNCLPNLDIFLYPGNGHNVVKEMMRARALSEFLKEENLETPRDVYHRYPAV